jgi:hypothetical protein
LVVGQHYLAMMPYDLQVLTTFKGWLPSEHLLPQRGNHIGDMWMADRIPWIWLVTPGTMLPQWVDP